MFIKIMKIEDDNFSECMGPYPQKCSMIKLTNENFPAMHTVKYMYIVVWDSYQLS